jgi:large subunit ribosomal protein L5
MSLKELPSALRRLAVREARPSTASISQIYRRYASTRTERTESRKFQREELKNAPKTESPRASETSATNDFESQFLEDIQDLEVDPSFMVEVPYEDEKIRSWNPVERSRSRRLQLPPSRYVCRISLGRINC